MVGGGDDGPGDGVLRAPLGCSGEGQQLVVGEGAGRVQLGQLGLATGQGAGLVEGDGTETAELLEVHAARSEEHTSELQSLMRLSSAVFCLKKTKKKQTQP